MNVKLNLVLCWALAVFEHSISKIYEAKEPKGFCCIKSYTPPVLLVFFNFEAICMFYSSLHYKCLNCLIISCLKFVLGLWRAVRMTLPYYTQIIS